MSIINDALKKTQMSFKKPKKKDEKKEEAQEKKSDDVTNVYEKLYKSKEEKAVAPQERAKTENKSKGPQEVFKTIFAVIFLIGSVGFSYKFLSGYEPLQDYIRSKTGKSRSSRQLIKKYVPTKKRVYKDGDLILNGVSTIDGQKVALINDEIYQLGEVVGNKVIIAIGKDEVDLQDDEKVYTIKVR